MDCERFDTHVIDELYGELDELTHAAMKRHAETCARCGGVLSGLRATREVGVLPLVEPSDDLEERILAATSQIARPVAWHKKLLGGLAWAGSHAMRPQLAMAAVLVLMLGSSLLLLRARPGSPGSAPVRVTERGEPIPEQQEVAAQATADYPAPAAAATSTAPTTLVPDEDGRPAKIAKDKESVGRAAATAGADDAKEAKAADQEGGGGIAALSEARSIRSQSGCAAAVGKFDEVGASFPGTAAAFDAMWDAAACHKSMGNADKHRELMVTLRGNAAYRDRAETELAAIEALAQQQAANQAPGGSGKSSSAGAARAPAAAKPKAALAPSPAPEAPAKAAPPSGGSTGKAPATTRKDAAGF